MNEKFDFNPSPLNSRGAFERQVADTLDSQAWAAGQAAVSLDKFRRALFFLRDDTESVALAHAHLQELWAQLSLWSSQSSNEADESLHRIAVGAMLRASRDYVWPVLTNSSPTLAQIKLAAEEMQGQLIQATR